MPSSPNYKRDYKQERKTLKARGEDKDDALRHRDRRLAQKLGMVKPKDGKDVDHKVPLSKGGAEGKKNIRVRSRGANRSFARTSSGAIKK